MNGTLLTRIRFPQDLALAARLIRYLMKNDSGVPANITLRDYSALNY